MVLKAEKIEEDQKKKIQQKEARRHSQSEKRSAGNFSLSIEAHLLLLKES